MHSRRHLVLKSVPNKWCHNPENQYRTKANGVSALSTEIITSIKLRTNRFLITTMFGKWVISKWQGNMIKFGRMNTAETKINFLSIIHVEASHRALGANRLIRFTFYRPALTEFILQPASHTHTPAPWVFTTIKTARDVQHSTRKITSHRQRIQLVTRQWPEHLQDFNSFHAEFFF
jgi:hypothetical protein